MTRKTKSMIELLSEEEIYELTSEAFTRPKVTTFKQPMVKWSLSIAASLMLILGVINHETVMANTTAFIAYIFGIGMTEVVDLDDYYVLDEEVKLTDNIIIQGIYRYKDTITVHLKSINGTPLNTNEIALKINGKTYHSSGGKSVAINQTTDGESTSETQEQSAVLDFKKMPKVNDVSVVLGEVESSLLTLKHPSAVELDELYQVKVGSGQLTVLPLTTQNDVIAISYDIEQVGKVPWTPWLHGAQLVDEFGNAFYAMDNGVNPYELRPLEGNGNQMVKLVGKYIRYSKDFNDLMTMPPKVTLPNPAAGETLKLDEVFKIDGIDLTIHSISRENENLTVTISKQTSHGMLDNIFFQTVGNLGLGSSGNHDENYFYQTYFDAQSDADDIEFYVSGLMYAIEQPYEIYFK